VLHRSAEIATQSGSFQQSNLWGQHQALEVGGAMFVAVRTRTAMSSLLLACSLMAVCEAAVAGDPELFRVKKFDAAMIAEAVNHYVAVGEERTKAELEALSPNDLFSPEMKAGMLSNEELAHRVSWMCIILWPAKIGSSQRPPGYGGLAYVEDRFDRKRDWPLFPVVNAGASYFVLSDSYILGGMAESPRHYLQACEAMGTFRTGTVQVPTRKQAEHDLLELRRSPTWTAAWSKSLVGEKGNSELVVWYFLRQQADRISGQKVSSEKSY
jgi:hypothetical protein